MLLALRAIGVSNFCAPCLECLAKVSETVPAVNQIQFYAGNRSVVEVACNT